MRLFGIGVFSLLLFSFVDKKSISTEDFYRILESGESVTVEQIEPRINLNSVEGKARLGALKMKAAQQYNTPAERLKSFKEGRILLEKEIEKNASNVEFRFLRLIIQEHAPVFLRYKGDLSTDASFIETHFNKVKQPLRQIIKNYSTKSGILKTNALK